MFNLFNFMFLTILIVFSTSFSEARLGKGQEEGRRLTPSAAEAAAAAAAQNADRQVQDINPPTSGDPASNLPNEAMETSNEDQCNSLCSDGNSVKVCHRRGDSFVEICTEAESFVDHKMLGDACGPCAVSGMGSR